MKEIEKKIDDILESYYKKQIDLLDVRKHFLKLIEENYVLRIKPDFTYGKCDECGMPLTKMERETCEDCLCPE